MKCKMYRPAFTHFKALDFLILLTDPFFLVINVYIDLKQVFLKRTVHLVYCNPNRQYKIISRFEYIQDIFTF